MDINYPGKRNKKHGQERKTYTIINDTKWTIILDGQTPDNIIIANGCCLVFVVEGSGENIITQDKIN